MDRNADRRPSAAPDLPTLQRRIRVALGQEPGDLVIEGGRIVNVFTERLEPGSVVIADGWIAGVGPYAWQARERINAAGRTIIPGLIDAHMHVESTLLMPAELARLVVPRGPTAQVSDPHEVGNVMGVRGIDMLIDASRGLPLDIFYMAPSCVPATSWEHAGATLGPAEIAELLTRPQVLGLAEVMDFPAVLAARDAVLEKIRTAEPGRQPIDGHAPRVTGQQLVAYVAAGIRSDHESTTVEEGLQKAALGMLVQVREGSSAHNLDTFLPLIAEGRLGDWCLATDDIHPDDLESHGHLDHLLARLVAGGVPAVQAVKHATLVPARHYGLAQRGAIAPGWRADVAVVDDLKQFRAHVVIKNGTIVAREGRYLGGANLPPLTEGNSNASLTKEGPNAPPLTKGGLGGVPENTVHLPALDESAFALRLTGARAPAIGIVPGQIVTRRDECDVARTNGKWSFDSQRDVALIASIERHRASGNVGLGLVTGFGFRREGALGSSVAHDSHNLVIAGTNPRDMLVAARALAETGGGFVAVADGAVLARLPLPFAGLISDAPAETVIRQLDEVRSAARRLGCPLACPFGTLSFLALPVIPELKITDQGMFDVNRQEFVRID